MKARSLLVAFILLLGVMSSAIGIAYARHESRQLFGQLQNLQKERDDLNVEFGRLQLEQATWAEANRIEQIARGQLGLVSVGLPDTVIIKR